jgi:hypothetical protein
MFSRKKRSIYTKDFLPEVRKFSLKPWPAPSIAAYYLGPLQQTN